MTNRKPHTVQSCHARQPISDTCAAVRGCGKPSMSSKQVSLRVLGLGVQLYCITSLRTDAHSSFASASYALTAGRTSILCLKPACGLKAPKLIISICSAMQRFPATAVHPLMLPPQPAIHPGHTASQLLHAQHCRSHHLASSCRRRAAAAAPALSPSPVMGDSGRVAKTTSNRSLVMPKPACGFLHGSDEFQ